MSLRRLSNSEQRGLFAELVFARRLSLKTSLAEMVASWGGPLGAAQDFSHPRLGYFEIKGLGIDARSVSISSVLQLDPVQESKVDVVVLRLEEDSLRLHEESESLPEIVSWLREKLNSESSWLEQFDERLAATGIDITDPTYSDVAWRVVTMECFRVGQDFPRLRRSNIPVGVEDVRYKLLLSALKEFSFPIDEALTLEGSQ